MSSHLPVDVLFFKTEIVFRQVFRTNRHIYLYMNIYVLKQLVGNFKYRCEYDHTQYAELSEMVLSKQKKNYTECEIFLILLFKIKKN